MNETQNLPDPVLLDTDVFSYLMKPGDPRGDPYHSHVARRMNAISHLTLGELLFGARWRNWNAARLADLRSKLREVVILPFDTEVCEDYARLKVAILSSGRVMADNDLCIAATPRCPSCPCAKECPYPKKHPEVFNVPEPTVYGKAAAAQ